MAHMPQRCIKVDAGGEKQAKDDGDAGCYDRQIGITTVSERREVKDGMHDDEL